jgi:hypothetical protein
MKEALMTSKRTYLIIVATIAAIILTLSAVAKSNNAQRPAASEFGPGPRTSARGLYIVTLEGADALKARRMYTLQALVIDGKNVQPVVDASITIDGGMPQHGHGLPTRPRVTQNLGNGKYEISGLRFNMGGWWEVKLAISGPAGSDTVTFNLSV